MRITLSPSTCTQPSFILQTSLRHLPSHWLSTQSWRHAPKYHDSDLTSIPWWYRNSPIFQYAQQCPTRSAPPHQHQGQTQPIKSTAPKRGKQRKQKAGKKRGSGKSKPDMNDQATLARLGVSKELMNFFYNGEIRRNRLRIEKAERERAEIEAIPTVKEQQISESRRRNKLYAKHNHRRIKQMEIAMDAAFIKTMDDINRNLGPKQQLITWPATPLSYN